MAKIEKGDYFLLEVRSTEVHDFSEIYEIRIQKSVRKYGVRKRYVVWFLFVWIDNRSPPIASKLLLEAFRVIASPSTTYFTQCLRHHGSFFVFPFCYNSL